MYGVPLLTQVAGGVVVGKKGDIAVVQTDGNSWSFPKGHVEHGETLLSTAQREIFEEIGIREITLIKELGRYTRCKIGKGGVGEDCSEVKEITIFLFETSTEELISNETRHTEAKWVAREQVADLLTHKKDKEFFLSIVDTLEI